MEEKKFLFILYDYSGALSKDFCETHKISEEEATNFGYTLLQKTAKSTCILKNTIIMDRMMRARTILAKNMYYSKDDTL